MRGYFHGLQAEDVSESAIRLELQHPVKVGMQVDFQQTIHDINYELERRLGCWIWSDLLDRR